MSDGIMRYEDQRLTDQLSDAAKDLAEALGDKRSPRIHRFMDLNEKDCHVQQATGYADQCVWVGTKHDRILLDVEMVNIDLITPLENFAASGVVDPMQLRAEHDDEGLRSTLEMVINSAKSGSLTKTQVSLAESILNAYIKEHKIND
jgi:hypothetical protein